jgi:hypothetical protein
MFANYPQFYAICRLPPETLRVMAQIGRKCMGDKFAFTEQLAALGQIYRSVGVH